jgi:hypothetical protein
MSSSPRIFSHVWLFFPVCALGFLVWANHGRMRRVEYVSGLEGRARPVDAIDPNSPTGYANGQRELLVPGRNESSFHWIAQTQQMFAQREGRVRHVDYDNAPFGREVNSSSPYRWWLGLIAWCDHMISGRPIGLSVEHAARWADPVLHGLLLLGGTVFICRRFGAFSAALFSLGVVTLFPFAAGFLPGMPDDHGLANVCALGSLVFLLAGMHTLRDGVEPDAGEPTGRQSRRWFALAGIAGGFGLWINVSVQVPMVAGIFLGALLAAGIMRAHPPALPLAMAPWRVWACGGGVMIFVAYLVEYFPAHLGSWQLESIHPLYGLAWIGGGELLARAVAWIQREKFSWSLRDMFVVVLAAAAVATVPVVMWQTGSRGFLAQDLLWARLTNLPDGAVAASVRAWLIRDGGTPTVWATLLPLMVLVPAGWLMFHRAAKLESRILLAVAVGPVLVALGFACLQLSWWTFFDGTLLGLIVAATMTATSRSSRWGWSALAALVFLPGITRLLPPKSAGAGFTLTAAETQELIDRHLAHWLARHAGEEGVVVYAPPLQTTTLCFYGGLRGIGTFAADNKAGFGSSLMIAGANSIEGAQEQLLAHRVRFIVIPSWDYFFDEFAQLYLAKKFSSRTSLLIQELRRWNVPPWLRPLPYQMPVSGGYESQSVLVFELVDEQSPVVATSRLAEYLVETGVLDQAASIGETLRHYPGDIGALTARAQVQNARGDSTGSAQTLEALLSRLSNGADRFLPWDRRVSLAIVLARGARIDQAREQVRRCLAEVDGVKLRSLTTGSLYSLQVLGKAFSLGINDPRLNELALDLLPDDLRSHL